jgi:hypothetical protein
MSQNALNFDDNIFHKMQEKARCYYFAFFQTPKIARKTFKNGKNFDFE